MTERNAVVMFVAAVVLTISIYTGTGTLTENHYDDAYITYRYAVNYSRGWGLVFNEGEHVDAASSFLYAVGLGLGTFYTGGSGGVGCERLSSAFNMIAVGVIAATVFASLTALGVWPPASVALALVAALHGFISGWAALGMDTAPFAAVLVLWAYWTFVRRHDGLAAAFTLLAVLMRFEGLLVVPVWLAATWGTNYLSGIGVSDDH